MNVTNDAWFGESPGPHQHFAQARFRAVEEGLPVVRVANSGVSGVVDPLGRVVTRSELFTATILDARLPRALPPTPYAELGDGPVLALLVLTSVAAALLRRRERSRADVGGRVDRPATDTMPLNSTACSMARRKRAAPEQRCRLDT